MDHDQRWQYIINLDEELLLGGVIISEWSTFLIKDTDQAFCAGANIATILAAQAAIESNLRYEYSSNQLSRKLGFYNLIEQSPLPDDLKQNLHALRRYRNLWVHVNNPMEDSDVLERPLHYEAELEQMAILAVRTMRQVIYQEQFL